MRFCAKLSGIEQHGARASVDPILGMLYLATARYWIKFCPRGLKPELGYRWLPQPNCADCADAYAAFLPPSPWEAVSVLFATME
jgi:hypothetical protein